MERRRFPWWGLAGIAVLAGFVSVVLLTTGYVSVRKIAYMDLYTGKFKTTTFFQGVPCGSKIRGNVAAGLIPGVNLNSYFDPEGRADWRRIGTNKTMNGANPAAVKVGEAVSVIRSIGDCIKYDPKPGFVFHPPNGFSRQAKQAIVLSSLEVFRKTGDPQEIADYFFSVVEQLENLDRQAEPQDILLPEDFLSNRDEFIFLNDSNYRQFRNSSAWPQLLESSHE